MKYISIMVFLLFTSFVTFATVSQATETGQHKAIFEVA